MQRGSGEVEKRRCTRHSALIGRVGIAPIQKIEACSAGHSARVVFRALCLLCKVDSDETPGTVSCIMLKRSIWGEFSGAIVGSGRPKSSFQYFAGRCTLKRQRCAPSAAFLLILYLCISLQSVS
jgi:hypothetical protein